MENGGHGERKKRPFQNNLWIFPPLRTVDGYQELSYQPDSHTCSRMYKIRYFL